MGTEKEFAEMCQVAKQEDIKIIVDVVFNHCASDYDSISSNIKKISRKVFHSIKEEPVYVNDRKIWTQGQLMGLWDFNTRDKKLQVTMLNFLNKCIEYGVYGFRFDAASHIELPDDDPSFASDFWPTIINNKASFNMPKF